MCFPGSVKPSVLGVECYIGTYACNILRSRMRALMTQKIDDMSAKLDDNIKGRKEAEDEVRPKQLVCGIRAYVCACMYVCMHPGCSI